MNIYMTGRVISCPFDSVFHVQSVRLYSSTCPGESSEARRNENGKIRFSRNVSQTSGRSVKDPGFI